MGKPSPQAPTAPDPNVVSAAQTKSNQDTATFQQKLNMVGTRGPDGTVSYQADPSQPGGYTQVTTLEPQLQAIRNGTLGIATDQLGRVSSALGQTLSADPSKLSYGAATGPLQSSFNTGPGVQAGLGSAGDMAMGVNLSGGFNQGQAVQGQVGYGDFGSTVKNAQDSSYAQAASRLDPQWGLAQRQEETALANQGLSQNSDAYKSAMDTFGRSKNDAYNQANFAAQQQGLAAQAQGYGQALSSGQFANQAAGQQFNQGLQGAQFANQSALAQAQFQNDAQQQKFGQNLAAGQFGNQAAGQIYAQNMGAADFANQAQNQGFNQSLQNAGLNNAAQQQYFQQQAAAQAQPINNLSALLSSSQVQQPTGIGYTPSQVSPTDVTGAYGLSAQAQQAAYNTQMQNQSSMFGGLFNLGSAAIKKWG